MARTKKTRAERNPVGRPNENLEDYYHLRMTKEDRLAWEAQAAAAGMTLGQWIRFQCVRAADGKVAPVSVVFTSSYPETVNA